MAIRNTTDNTTNSFAGIYFQAGETSSGSQINSARIAAIRTAAFLTDLAFATRGASGAFAERMRINSAGLVTIPGTLTTTGLTTMSGGFSATGASYFGVDDTGIDVTFFGATAGRYMKWVGASADKLLFSDNAAAYFGTDSDSYLFHSGSSMALRNNTGTMYFQSNNIRPIIQLHRYHHLQYNLKSLHPVHPKFHLLEDNERKQTHSLTR